MGWMSTRLIWNFSALGVVLWADMQEGERQAIRSALEVRYGLAIFVILLSWALLGIVVQALYREYVQGPLSLREQALVIATSNPSRQTRSALSL